MRPQYLYGILALGLLACSGSDTGTTAPIDPAPATPPVLLREIEIPNLPAPYYHFEYDTQNRVNVVSFASDFTHYAVMYDGDRIKELDNMAGTRDKLVYSYDAAGRVDTVKYVDSNGAVFTTVSLSYNSQQLIGLERRRKLGSTLVLEKSMSFAYYADGNLEQITDHRLAVEGQQAETTTIDRFEHYDDKINVDAFSLIHNDFFDHLVLLPGVQLQKGNPGKESVTGDGENYTVAYVYSYDDARRPLTKSGTAAFTAGPLLGETFQVLSRFTYY